MQRTLALFPLPCSKRHCRTSLLTWKSPPFQKKKKVDYIQVYPDIEAPDLNSTGNWRTKIILNFIKKSNKENISRDISSGSLQEVVLVEIHMNEIHFIDSIYPDILSRVKQLPGQVYSNCFQVEGGNCGFIILPNFDLSNLQTNSTEICSWKVWPWFSFLYCLCTTPVCFMHAVRKYMKNNFRCCTK